MSVPASVEIQAKSSGLRGQLREARSQIGRFADWTATKFGGGLAKLGSKKGGFFGKGSFLGDAGRSAAGNIAANVTSRATDFLTDMGKGVFDFEQRLTRLKIQAGETPEEMDKLSRAIRGASDEFGISRSDILAGAETFVTLTGRMDIAKDSARTFAKVAQATGSSVNDIARSADALFQQFGIGANDFEAAFSGMTAQGKAGAIELKDLASELSTIAPQFAQFAGAKGTRGIRELGAAMQIVKKGFGGDAGETTTGLSNFITAINKKSFRFKDAGVASFFTKGKNGKKELKDFRTIIDQISNSRLARDPAKLQKVFGSVEAYRAYIQLRNNRDELDRMIKIGEDGGVIQRDLTEYLASSSGKIARTWEQVKNDVAAAFTPDRIQAAVQGFGEIAKHAGLIGSGLKMAGDFFGGFKKAGQDIRAMFTGEGKITMMDRMLAKAGDEGKMAKIDNLKAQASLVALRAADNPLARQKLGLGNTDSATLAFQYANAEGPGAVAKRRAAEEFFKERGMTPGVTGLAEQMSKMVDELKTIAENTAQQLQVKIGPDPVATAAKNAPKHRRAVAK